jgi:hypothetical protein
MMAGAAIVASAAGACGLSIPEPARAPQPDDAFAEVPYPPPAARVETLPPRPRADARWIDGQWSWDASRWTWMPGGWVSAPPASRFARWNLRRLRDGRLEFAPASWRDVAGRELAAPPFLASARAEGSQRALPARCP